MLDIFMFKIKVKNLFLNHHKILS